MGESELIIAIVSILSLFVAMPAIVFKGILELRKQRIGPSEDSVGLAELEVRIEEAVTRANAPLLQKIDRLERTLALPERSRAADILEAEMPPERTALLAEEKTILVPRRDRIA